MAKPLAENQCECKHAEFEHMFYRDGCIADRCTCPFFTKEKRRIVHIQPPNAWPGFVSTEGD